MEYQAHHQLFFFYRTGAAANLDVSGDADGGSYSLLGETVSADGMNEHGSLFLTHTRAVPQPVAPRPVKSWVARIWQGMDRKYIRPVLNVTEDGQGTQSWSDIRRTISNYFSGIPEDTRCEQDGKTQHLYIMELIV